MMTQSKTATHIQSRRDAAQRSMGRVCRLLHYSEDSYCWMKYRRGLEYLRIYLRGDTHAISQMERSSIYWGWWKNQWTLREEEFLTHYADLERLSVKTRRLSYGYLHNAAALAAEMNPTSKSLGESYAAMIAQVFEEAKTHNTI